MEGIVTQIEDLQRQITELKDGQNKLNDNQRSLLEFLQQSKSAYKSLQEKVDILTENVDDVKTTVCHVGKISEAADKKVQGALDEVNKLHKDVEKHVHTVIEGMNSMANDLNTLENNVDNVYNFSQNAINISNSNKIAVDKITDSFGTLLSKSNQALDCIDKVQDHINEVEKITFENKDSIELLSTQLELGVESISERVDKIKRKQKRKSKNITLVIK